MPSYLYRNEYATFKQIKTQTISVERDGDSKKAKLFITLDKHPKFEENMKKFEEIKAENDKLVGNKEETKQWIALALSFQRVLFNDNHWAQYTRVKLG